MPALSPLARKADIISRIYVSSLPALVLCGQPQLGDRIATALARCAVSTSADSRLLGRAALIVWTDSGGDLEEVIAGAGAEAEIIAVSDRDLGGAITCLRPERVSHFILPGAVERDLAPTVAKLAGSAELFGLSGYLPGVVVEELEIDGDSGRDRALSVVDRLAAERRMRRTARDRIASACDELLMNALYDAPVDERGELLFASVAPSARRSMRSPRPVSLRYAASDDQLAVSVTDRYGRLDKATVLETLETCLRSADPIDDKPLGAGLGLYTTASAARGLVVNVEAGAATEVIATFGRDRTPLELFGFFAATTNGRARA